MPIVAAHSNHFIRGVVSNRRRRDGQPVWAGSVPPAHGVAQTRQALWDALRAQEARMELPGGFADAHTDRFSHLRRLPDALRQLGVDDAHAAGFLDGAVRSACDQASSMPNGYLFNALVEMLAPGVAVRPPALRQHVNGLIEQLAGIDALAQGADFELRHISDSADSFAG